MANRRTTEEQLEALSKKQEQMKAQEKALKKRLSEENRKARTRRLIKIGAEVESVYGKAIEEDKLPRLRKFLQEQEYRGSFLTKALEKADDDDAAVIKEKEEV